MYKQDKNSNSLQNKIKINNNKVFCTYCRNYLNEPSPINTGTQVCPNCLEIISKIQLLNKNKLNLPQNEQNAIKLIEINHDIKLPVLNPKILTNFSKKNKYGVVIKDNKVLAVFLDNHDFCTFPDELFYFKEIKFISLMNTKIKNLPSKIYSLSNLEALDLRKNSIEFLPDSLTELKKLKILLLKDNSLRLLPDEIGQIKSIIHLDLENNLLYSIPDSFKDLENLQVLNLFDNQIKLKLIVGKMPNQLLKCGIGGNSTKKSIRLLKSIFKGKKCKIYLNRNKSWDKKLN